MPEVTPSRQQPFTHDFTLQAIMEMQKAQGVLIGKVDGLVVEVQRLAKSVDETNGKIDKLKHWQSRLLGGAAVLAAVVAIVWTVLNVVPWQRISIAPAAEVKGK